MRLTNKILIILVLITTISVFSSCKKEFYKEELYRKEIYLVSGENNIFGQEYSFGGAKGYLSVYAGGATSVDHDVTVLLTRDDLSISEYNKRNFDQDYDKYAQELPQGNYTIENMAVTLKANKGIPNSLCPIDVNIDGLSPDATYFIPLKIESVSDYMASKSKNYALFQIYMKNEYATTKKITYYMMVGTSQKGTMNGDDFQSSDQMQVINASKVVKPISVNSIRILPAARQSIIVTEIRQWGITVTVDPTEIVNVPILVEGVPTGEYMPMEKVTLTPFIDSQVAVKLNEIDGKVSTYDPVTGIFYLYYRYNLSTEGTTWYEVMETMTNPLLTTQSL